MLAPDFLETFEEKDVQEQHRQLLPFQAGLQGKSE